MPTPLQHEGQESYKRTDSPALQLTIKECATTTGTYEVGEAPG
jgi:hypothetical protein